MTIRSIGFTLATLACSGLLNAQRTPGGGLARFHPAADSGVRLHAGSKDANLERVAARWANLPLYFEQSPGDSPGSGFIAQGLGYRIEFTPRAAVLRFADTTAPLSLEFEGANSDVSMVPEKALESHTNYISGNDPKQWRTNVKNYARLRYRDVWPGVDVVFYGNQESLEYDLVLAPHADLSRVGFKFSGGKARIEPSGALRLERGDGVLEQKTPVVYQEVEGVQHKLKARYVALGENRVGFDVEGYDPTRALVIDPVMDYSTYIGGSLTEWVYGIAVDSTGAAYLTGTSTSPGFAKPLGLTAIRSGPPHAFVMKLDPSGSKRVYTTYVGGNSTEEAESIGVDGLFQAHIAGRTDSLDFPRMGAFAVAFGGVIPAGVQHPFVATLNATGDGLIYAGVLNGDGNDVAWDIAVDSRGFSCVVGDSFTHIYNFSSPFQPFFLGGDYDAFVLKLDPGGSPIWATYLGGEGNDGGYATAIDSSGRCYVSGTTSSNFFANQNGHNGYFGGEVYIARISANGQNLDYASFIRGTHGANSGFAYQEPYRIAVDSANNVYVGGWTTASDFPTTTGVVQPTYGGGEWDGFVARFDSTGNLVFATYLGGGGGDNVLGLQINQAGNIVAGGRTNSPNFYVTAGAVQRTFGGGLFDGFVLTLSADGSKVISSTYLGGSLSDEISNLALGPDRTTIYATGYTQSVDFPTSSVALQKTLPGTYSSFVTKLTDPGDCLVTLNSGAIDVAATVSSGSIAIQASRTNCAWFASTTNPEWVQLSRNSGNGSDSLAYTLVANTSSGPRVGIVRINGASLRVYQFGQGCQLVIAPDRLVVDHLGGQRSISLFLPVGSGCGWTAQTDSPDWISLSSASGQGSAIFKANLGANPGNSVRTGKINLGTQTVTVIENPSSCKVTLSSGNGPFDLNGGAGLIDVLATGADCAWSASVDSPWIRLVDQTGEGRGRLRFTVATLGKYTANGPDATADRMGTIKVNDQTFQVVQSHLYNDKGSGAPAGATLGGIVPLTGADRAVGNAASRTLDAEGCDVKNFKLSTSGTIDLQSGGQAQLQITFPGSCHIYLTAGANSNVTITPQIFDGTSPANFTLTDVSNNSVDNLKNVLTLTVGSTNTLAVTINRVSSVCTVKLQTPPELSPSPDQQQVALAVEASRTDCTWTVAAPGADWISFPGTGGGTTAIKGTGTGTLSMAVAQNPSGNQRTGTIRFNDNEEVKVVQQGATPPAAPPPCTLSLGASTLTLGPGAQNRTMQVSTSTDSCGWTAAVAGSFLSFPGASSGTGNGGFQVALAANSDSNDRSGTVTITGTGGNTNSDTVTIKQPAGQVQPTPLPSGTITASPNPIQVCDASSVGQTTLSWTTSNVTNVEVRLNGAAVGSGGASGSLAKSASNGAVFELWDVSPGKTPTKLNSVTVTLTTSGCPTPGGATGTIAATPNPIQVCDGSGIGQATISWTTTGVTNIEIRLLGTAVNTGGPSGSFTTGKWVGANAVFELWDVSPGKTAAKLASVTVAQSTSGCGGPIVPSGTITASPSPIQVCDGSGLGVTTISWTSANVTAVEVRLLGNAVGSGGASGSFTTGKWVGANAVFELWDVSPGRTAAKLASVTVTQTTSGCGSPVVPAGTITASPNPIQVCDGSGIGVTTITWTSTNVTSVEIHLLAAVVGSGGASGSFTTGKWVGANAVFELWDVSTSRTGTKLASVTVTQTTAGCPGGGGGGGGAGTPPPAALINNNVNDWDYGASNGSDNADLAARQFAPTIIAMSSNTGDGGYFAYPSIFAGTRAVWDLRTYKTLNFSLSVQDTSGNGAVYKSGTPYVILNSASGQMKLTRVGSLPAPSRAYIMFNAPLAGSSDWSAQTTGTFRMDAVTSVQVGFTLTNHGFLAFLADVSFGQ